MLCDIFISSALTALHFIIVLKIEKGGGEDIVGGGGVTDKQFKQNRSENTLERKLGNSAGHKKDNAYDKLKLKKKNIHTTNCNLKYVDLFI